MSEEQRIEAVRDYLRGLAYRGKREMEGHTTTDFLAGLHLVGMGQLLLETDDEDIAKTLDAGRVLNGAERQAG